MNLFLLVYLVSKLRDVTPRHDRKRFAPVNSPMNVFRRMKESAYESMLEDSQNTTHDSSKRYVQHVAAVASFKRMNMTIYYNMVAFLYYFYCF